MREVSEYITGILNNNADLVSFTNSEMFPLIAPQASKTPFLNYHLKRLSKESNDGIWNWELVIMGFAENYDQLMSLLDKIDTAFESEVFKDSLVDPSYSDEKNEVIIIKYQFIK